MNLNKIMPLALSFSLNASLPKSVSNVMMILPCLFARFSTSLSLKPVEIFRVVVMSMSFCLRVSTALSGMFSSARNLVKVVDKPSLLSGFLWRILELRLCLLF